MKISTSLQLTWLENLIIQAAKETRLKLEKKLQLAETYRIIEANNILEKIERDAAVEVQHNRNRV
jgi:hypothetical protein